MNNYHHSNIVPFPHSRTESVSVIVDGWNVLLGAADGFGYSRRPLSTFTLDMPRLADGVVARRRRAGRAVRIGIILGRHEGAANPAARAAQDAATRQWARDSRVTLIDPGMVPVGRATAEVATAGDRTTHTTVVPIRRYREEYGDAAVQQLLTQWTDDGLTDAAILLSADADHAGCVADIRSRRRTHVEVARWEWQASTLWQPGLWVHHLAPDLLDSVTTYRDPRKAA
ncbi:hypothetical protein [Dietzia maris]|uniref:NYN domain-containing protein n=1 Tax=Dietzia maris TaxID=37915 RepID=A0ABT8GZE9_9ACTN|nr:hypothetical protein [Dietzia maris]MDN4505588.1 hypothetical protein [Dietzia maris]